MMPLSLVASYQSFRRTCMVSRHRKQYSPPSLSEPHIPVPSCLATWAPNTAHSCSRHSVATVWLPSEQPHSVIHVPKTITFLGHTVSKCDAGSHYHTSNNSSLYTMEYLDFLTVYYLK